jgi:hypothetical protein
MVRQKTNFAKCVRTIARNFSKDTRKKEKVPRDYCVLKKQVKLSLFPAVFYITRIVIEYFKNFANEHTQFVGFSP